MKMKTDVKINLTDKRVVIPRPCAKCPWRATFKGDDDYLRPGRRAEIARALLDGGDFPCHETIDSDEYLPGDGTTCSGAALVMLRAGHEGPLKFAMRLKMIDVEAFEAHNDALELWTLREALDELHDDDDVDDPEEGTCNTVEAGCEAPAGFMTGGEVVHGDTLISTTCPGCGEFVCDNCSDDDGMCFGMCSEEEPDDGWD